MIMNHLSTLLPTLCVLLLVSCTSGSDPEPVGENPDWNIPLEIHVQSYFKDDRVRIELDEQVIFDGQASTSALLGVAERLVLKRDSGSHLLSVTVNSAVHTEEPFLLENALYIGIGYHDEKVTFRFSDERFVYD